MIVFLFDHYFNPLMITHMRQDKNNVIIYLPDGSLEIKNAQVHDVAATINDTIELFNKR
jgi:hypothetical protein